MVKTVVVAGDVAVDWIAWEKEPGETGCHAKKSPPNWTIYTGLQMRARPGGAMLLAHMLSSALENTGPNIDIVSYLLENPGNFYLHSFPAKVLNSLHRSDSYPTRTRTQALPTRTQARAWVRKASGSASADERCKIGTLLKQTSQDVANGRDVILSGFPYLDRVKR